MRKSEDSDYVIRAWITKYALSLGIQEVEGYVSSIGSGGMFCYGNEPGEMSQTAHGNDWHRSLESALNRADKMRNAKIVSLRKQIAKLEKMTW